MEDNNNTTKTICLKDEQQIKDMQNLISEKEQNKNGDIKIEIVVVEISKHNKHQQKKTLFFNTHEEKQDFLDKIEQKTKALERGINLFTGTLGMMSSMANKKEKNYSTRWCCLPLNFSKFTDQNVFVSWTDDSHDDETYFTIKDEYRNTNNVLIMKKVIEIESENYNTVSQTFYIANYDIFNNMIKDRSLSYGSEPEMRKLFFPRLIPDIKGSSQTKIVNFFPFATYEYGYQCMTEKQYIKSDIYHQNDHNHECIVVDTKMFKEYVKKSDPVSKNDIFDFKKPSFDFGLRITIKSMNRAKYYTKAKSWKNQKIKIDINGNPLKVPITKDQAWELYRQTNDEKHRKAKEQINQQHNLLKQKMDNGEIDCNIQ